MDQIEKVADVMKNWRKYSSPESTSTRGRVHAGIKQLAPHWALVADAVAELARYARHSPLSTT